MTAARAPSPSYLPIPLTRLVGRVRERDELRDLLAQPHVRLLTLTGPGGVGKTRLAIAVAGDLSSTFVGGSAFVALAPITDPALVAPAISVALGLVEVTGRQPLERLVEHVADRVALLVLDNFEQVVEAAPLVGTLLAGCPNLTILVTSRTPLHLSGEQDYLVEPLPVPAGERLPAPDQLVQVDAVALFVQRARERRADFQLTTANAPAVVEICRRLDGLPLALELAAARSGLLAPHALAERLHPRLPLLTGGPRDAPARQQTLRATIAWSYDLLSVEQQCLYQQLTVFAGGWTLEAAEAVCNPDADVLSGLGALVEHSLVRQVSGPDGADRYVMLETIREFAREQLAASGALGEAGERHAAYFAGLAAQLLPYPPTGVGTVARLDRLEAELDNLRSALSWLLDRQPAGALQLAADLLPFWLIRGYFSEGRRWLEAGLERASDAALSVRADALGHLAELAAWQGDHALAARLNDAALGLHEEAGDRLGAARDLFGIARLESSIGDPERAVRLYEQSIAVQREFGDWFGVAGGIGNLGWIARTQGDLESAERLMAEALALTREHGFVNQTVIWLGNLGELALRRGERERARALLSESLTLERELRQPRTIAESLDQLAQLASLEGRPERATRLVGAAAAIREEHGLPRERAALPDHEHLQSALRAALSEATFAAAWAEGQAMSLEQAIDYALAPAATPVAAAPLAPVSDLLSKRELEVLRLVAEGKSNQEIAAALFISPHTVGNHVASIFNKLGLDSRTAAAAYALRHGLV